MIRVSAGTAAVLGLKTMRLDARPTTAYLMAGGQCLYACGFCPQGRASHSRAGLLARVTWPEADRDVVVKRLHAAYRRREIARVCIQTVHGPNYREDLAGLLSVVRKGSDIPVSLCVGPSSRSETASWFTLGADRLGLPLDTAGPGIHRCVKGRSWEQDLAVIEEAAVAFPGRVSTHLIVGLGETEEELMRLLGGLIGKGITVALFAFTPVAGTPLERLSPPSLHYYRRVQAVRYLLARGLLRVENLVFRDGRLVDTGVQPDRLRAMLSGGEAFQTSGCPGCNRPYYNERPGGRLYNYPRPLSPEEAAGELGLILGIDGDRDALAPGVYRTR